MTDSRLIVFYTGTHYVSIAFMKDARLSVLNLSEMNFHTRNLKLLLNNYNAQFIGNELRSLCLYQTSKGKPTYTVAKKSEKIEDVIVEDHDYYSFYNLTRDQYTMDDDIHNLSIERNIVIHTDLRVNNENGWFHGISDSLYKKRYASLLAA